MFQRKWQNPSKTKTYYSWKSMRARCYDKNHVAYLSYGGRGITVCDQWKDDYDAFVEDMGLCPDGMTIERIDNAGNYKPGNCRWATRKEQARNRRNNRTITFEGKTQTITDWSNDLGVSVGALDYRISRNLSIDEVMKTEMRRSREAPHGTVSRYTNRKCRCDLCRQAWRDYTNQRRAKFREYS